MDWICKFMLLIAMIEVRVLFWMEVIKCKKQRNLRLTREL